MPVANSVLARKITDIFTDINTDIVCLSAGRIKKNHFYFGYVLNLYYLCGVFATRSRINNCSASVSEPVIPLTVA